MSLLTIVQARMGSTRLPGKTLERINGKAVLRHVLDRVEEAGLTNVVVATTWAPEDDAIVQFCDQHGVSFFRGWGDDVLARFYDCALAFRADPIIRVTADCPFLVPDLLEDVAMMIEHAHYAYVGVQGAPDGYHAEAFTLQALKEAFTFATSPEDREHVVPWMIRNLWCAWIRVVLDGEPTTLDTPEDLERLRKLAA